MRGSGLVRLFFFHLLLMAAADVVGFHRYANKLSSALRTGSCKCRGGGGRWAKGGGFRKGHEKALHVCESVALVAPGAKHARLRGRRPVKVTHQ